MVELMTDLDIPIGHLLYIILLPKIKTVFKVTMQDRCSSKEKTADFAT